MLVTVLRNGAVEIGGKPYRSRTVARARFELARRNVRNPLKWLLCTAVLLELKAGDD